MSRDTRRVPADSKASGERGGWRGSALFPRIGIGIDGTDRGTDAAGVMNTRDTNDAEAPPQTHYHRHHYCSTPGTRGAHVVLSVNLGDATHPSRRWGVGGVVGGEHAVGYSR